MSVYNHRAMVPATTPQHQSGRILEMLDTIRADFDQLTQEAYICKSQRDEFENRSTFKETFLFYIHERKRLIKLVLYSCITIKRNDQISATSL